MSINKKFLGLVCFTALCSNVFASDWPVSALREQIEKIYHQGVLPHAGLQLNTKALGYRCVMSDGVTGFSVEAATYKLLLSEAKPAVPDLGPLQPGQPATPAVYSKAIGFLTLKTDAFELTPFSFSPLTPILALQEIILATENKDQEPQSFVDAADPSVQTRLAAIRYGELDALISVREAKDATSSKTLYAVKIDWSLEASRCELQCSDLQTDFNSCSECESQRPGNKVFEYQDYGYCWK